MRRVCALIVIILFASVPTIARASAADPRVFLDHSANIFDTTTAAVGTRFNVTLWIENVNEVGGVQVYMDFNDSVINVTRWFEPEDDPLYIFYGRATSALPPPPNDAGYIHLGPERGRVLISVSLFPPNPPYFSGMGKICIFEVVITLAPPVNGQVSSALRIDSADTYVLDGDGNEVPGVTKEDGFFTFSCTLAIQSCDAAGIEKNSFSPSEDVYANGSDYAPSTTYDIYVVSHKATWNPGDAIPPRIIGTLETITSDASGKIDPTIVWGAPLIPGLYDIVVDIDGDGMYDADEPLDSSDIVGAGFFIVPELWLGSVLGLAGCFAALELFRLSKRKHL